jgi:F-type H+-transporting ATPase subunit epsilon
MHLEIVTPDKKIFDGSVKLVRVPGTKGSFAVLNNHTPIISTLEKGSVKIIEENGKELFFEIDGGIIDVRDNKIIVLAETIPQ